MICLITNKANKIINTLSGIKTDINSVSIRRNPITLRPKFKKMKKLFFALFALFFAAGSIAQNLEDINEMLVLRKLKDAKAGIDKYLLNPKKANDSEGWYMKGRVYNAFARDSSISNKEKYELTNAAVEAFKKTQELDKKDVRMKEENNVSYFEAYIMYYNLGISNFNVKDYEGAFQAFRSTNDLKDFLISRKYSYDQISLVPFDTAMIINIAICAKNANREAEFLSYYSKIPEANIGGREYKEIYQFLLEHYIEKQNELAFQELLKKSKVIYPGDETWIDLEIKYADKKGGKAAVTAKYEEILKEYPTNFVLHYNYAVELYNNLYGKDAQNAGDTAMVSKLTTLLKKTIEIESKEDVSSLSLMCKHLYNRSSDLLSASAAIKGPNPENLKKKAALKAEAMKFVDQCITYAETAINAYESLSKKTLMQKADYRIILGYLSELYGLKKNQPKVDYYEKKYAAAEI
jgi:hypothetical protein